MGENIKVECYSEVPPFKVGKIYNGQKITLADKRIAYILNPIENDSSKGDEFFREDSFNRFFKIK